MSPTTDAAGRLPESTTSELLLAVDAGGTKTVAWLVESAAGTGHRIVGRGRSTGGNPTSVGFTTATRAITEAFEQARDDAKPAFGPVSRAVLSIAGALDSNLRDRFIGWARELKLAQQVAVVPDFLPVLAAGTPQCCGVALICGTGSSAYARSSEGRTALCGGWGYLLGDEGSGYAIGRAAIRAAVDDEETKSPALPLTTALLDMLKTSTAKELSKSVYRSPDPRAMVASVAPLVTRMAEEGDEFAAVLVDGAARDLAELAARAAQSVGLADRSFAIAATGGVLVSSNRLQEQLRSELQAKGLDCQIGVVAEPLVGCVRLAEREFSEVAVEWR